MNTKHTSVSVLIAAGVALLLAGAAQAMDTDVYLRTTTSASGDDSPNVLIIFDNSISMATQVDTQVPYNPATTYTYAGSGTAFDTTRIYWKTSSQPRPTSATSNPGQWFSIANNECRSSRVPNAGNASDQDGEYGVRAAGWNAATGWKALDTTDRRVECQADSPADTAGTYAQASPNATSAPNTMYTTNQNKRLTWSTSMFVTMYSGNYLNYLSTQTGPAQQSKLQIAKDAINKLIDTNPGVRFGMITFNSNLEWPDDQQNSGGRVVFALQNMDDTKRTTLKSIVNSLTASTATPLAETLYEASLYLRGQTPRYGNYTSPTNPLKDTGAQSGGKYVSPFNASCQKTYIILVTDGDPTYDENADSLIDGLGGISTPPASQPVDYYATHNLGGSPAASAGHKSRLAVLAEWLKTTDLIPNNVLDTEQVAVTYTIGFNAGDGINPEGIALLQATATAGGGGYFAAANAQELSDALQSTLVQIQTEAASFTAPSLSVNAFNTLFNRDDVYFAMFQPAGTRRWDGNIKKYTLCKDTTVSATCAFGEIIDYNGAPAVDTSYNIKSSAVSFWSNPTTDGDKVALGGAGSEVPSSDNRTIYTYTGSYDSDNIRPTGGAPVSLDTTAHKVTTTNVALTTALLGVPDDPARTDLINWIRGKDSYGEFGTDKTADRPWRLYDPIHSRPVIINYGGTNSNPILKVFVGSNDGMIHMLNEKTGEEEWAFLPQELLAQQRSLGPNANGEHLWGMDGTPYVDVYDKNGDAQIDPADGDYVHLYMGMRRGGRNIYALDVTPGAVLTDASATGGVKPKLRWVIRGGVSTGYESLGQTWSRPVVTRIRSGTGNKDANNVDESQTISALFFAGGYDTVNDSSFPAPTTTMGNAVYIADPTTGARIWWASANSGASLSLPRMQYSIPSDLTLMDANGDGAVDRVYVGDVGGQVFRIDLSPTLRVNNNGGSTGYVFADLACTSGSRPSCTGTAIQDRRRFFFAPDVAQVDDSIYSTTAKYDIVTIASGDREDPLDLLTTNMAIPQPPVHNRLYALRDYNVDAMSTGGSITYPTTITDAVLYDATANTLQTADSTTIAASGIKSSKGWYINFIDEGSWTGEKSLARTSIFGGTLYATTYSPNATSTAAASCIPEIGAGTLYAINILNGAATVDLTGNGSLSTDDRSKGVGYGIPSEHVVIIRPEGTSDLVGTASPGAVNQQLQREKTYWFQ